MCGGPKLSWDATVCLYCRGDFKRGMKYESKTGEKVTGIRRKYTFINRPRYDFSHMKYRTAKHGITVDKYNKMLEIQDSKCAICRSVPEVFHIDHDHITNQVRGLLCANCNRALGWFRDNKRSLARAISYLKGELFEYDDRQS